MTTYVFIADLHLSQKHPCLVQGFFALLKHYKNYPNVHLYILGDWFNAWLGDDVESHWLDEIIEQLQQFTQVGHQLYFLVGNRDFTLGQDFLKKFNGQLLCEVSYLNIAHYRIRIEHGDALCTDDVDYQRFKKIIRSPMVLGILKRLPLSLRQKMADGFRKKSKQSNQTKSSEIMDVNAQAVNQAIQGIDVLIHGHTHRPKIHYIQQKQRIVLGDWREQNQQVSAMILEICVNGQLNFKEWVVDCY